MNTQWDQATFTDEGFLLDRAAWTPSMAESIAGLLDVDLTDEHWQVIYGVRAFYDRTGRSLSMRPLIRVVRNEVNANLGTSIELARLFGNKTTRYVAMISGLPKPSDCI